MSAHVLLILCRNGKHVNFCIVALISLCHLMLIKFIGCVTDVIELIC